MLSGTAEYALRAVVFIARESGGVPVRASRLSEATGIPRNYLGKILLELVRVGVLRSSRGRRGGFALAVPPSKLFLVRVVAPFDQVDGKRRCLMGRPECGDEDPCPVHHRWKGASEHISRFFRDTTLADVVADSV